MKIYAILIAVYLVAMSTPCYGMDSKQFEEQISKIQGEKFDEVGDFLRKNEFPLQQDPEYFVILLNYVVAKGNRSGITVAKGEPQGDDLTLRDQKTGEMVGFLGYREGYDEKLIVDGISKVQDALKFFKSRLDIRFGIVEAAKKIKRWDVAGKQLVEILKVSKEINNKWSWGSIGSPKGNLNEFMIENVQAKIAYLFNLDNPVADEALIQVSQSLIKYYPDVIYGYSNLGVFHLAKKEYDKAKKYLNEALIIDPNDEIIKGNIAILEKNLKK